MVGTIVITLNKQKPSSFSFSDDYILPVKSTVVIGLQSILCFNFMSDTIKTVEGFLNAKKILDLFEASCLKWGINNIPKPYNFAHNGLVSMVAPGGEEPNPAKAFVDLSQLDDFGQINPNTKHVIKDIQGMDNEQKHNYLESVKEEGTNLCAVLRDKMLVIKEEQGILDQAEAERTERQYEWDKERVIDRVIQIEVIADDETDSENSDNEMTDAPQQEASANSAEPSASSAEQPVRDLEESLTKMELDYPLDISHLNISLLTNLDLLDYLEYLPYLRYLILVWIVFKSIRH